MSKQGVNLSTYLSRLTSQAEVIARFVEGIDDTQAHWKPALDQWSILEVINHLVDEEVEDFRIRLQLTMHEPTQPWPPNDPVRKVTERDYNSRDLDTSLANFLGERTKSIEWLRTIDSPKWDNAHSIPDVGSLRAGDILVSWVAHDILHLRQFVELNYAYQSKIAFPYSVDYAGDW